MKIFQVQATHSISAMPTSQIDAPATLVMSATIRG
jgi:hypothetical protein